MPNAQLARISLFWLMASVWIPVEMGFWLLLRNVMTVICSIGTVVQAVVKFSRISSAQALHRFVYTSTQYLTVATESSNSTKSVTTWTLQMETGVILPAPLKGCSHVTVSLQFANITQPSMPAETGLLNILSSAMTETSPMGTGATPAVLCRVGLCARVSLQCVSRWSWIVLKFMGT